MKTLKQIRDGHAALARRESAIATTETFVGSRVTCADWATFEALTFESNASDVYQDDACPPTVRSASFKVRVSA